MGEKKATTSQKTKHKIWDQKLPINRVYLLVSGILLLLAGSYLSLVRYRATHNTPTLPNPGQTISSESSQPDESKPDSSLLDKYTVPADQPRSIRIKSVDITGLVQRVGLTKDNAMAVPSNIHFAGWYVNSVLPGKPGLSIINGHVSGIYADAIFKQMLKVKANDVVEIEFGDKSIKKFLVLEIKAFPEDQSAQYLSTPKAGIVSQLNLITCGGKFDKASQRYEDRIIVTTKLISA